MEAVVMGIATPFSVGKTCSMRHLVFNYSQVIHLCSSCGKISTNYIPGFNKFERQNGLSIYTLSNQGRSRKASTFASRGEVEKSLQSTMEMDRFIDKLRVTDERKLPEVVAENILGFNSAFWMRLAARTDLCESQDDKEDFEELASSLMSMVDRYVQKTEEKIESATDVLKAILKPITNEDEEIVWPPEDSESINLMKKELVQREQEGQLDEGFLSEVNAQLRQAKADDDKPGLVALLQKVLQLYASRWLSKRSYAKKGGKIIKEEEFLETIIKADEKDWNRSLLSGLTYGSGAITVEEFNGVIDKRVERTLMRTQGGSYQQRVVCEYLNEIKSRVEDLEAAFQNPQPSQEL